MHRLPSMMFLGLQNQSPVCRNSPLADPCMVHWGFHFKLKAQICLYLLCNDPRSHFLLKKTPLWCPGTSWGGSCWLEGHSITGNSHNCKRKLEFLAIDCFTCVYTYMYICIDFNIGSLSSAVNLLRFLFVSWFNLYAWEPCGFGCTRKQPIFEYVVIYNTT